MKCLSPISVRKPIPGKSRSAERIPVPCGVCEACLSNRREDWRIRLSEESKNQFYNYFITLTYDEDNIVYGQKLGTVVKVDAQAFIKRLREKCRYHKDSKIRYYLVAEYGTRTFRPHYHILLFSSTPVDVSFIGDSWGKGNYLVEKINDRRVSYIAKYHVNRGHFPEGSEKPFVLLSKGIGKSYIDKMKRFHAESLNNMYYPEFRLKKRLPRYYKDRLYSKLDREKLALLHVGDVYDEAKIKEFNRKHPGENHFEDVYKRYKTFQEKFKEKSNFNNLL